MESIALFEERGPKLLEEPKNNQQKPDVDGSPSDSIDFGGVLPGMLHVVISGNEGLGKSYFAIWMLVRWLRKRLSVLWHSSGNEFFFSKDGKVLRDRYENVRYIVDGAMPRLSLSALQSFVAHYPDSSQHKRGRLMVAQGVPPQVH
ncbi:hypothetical protein WJX75_008620 [Coccomyxa subellipsoidea]|uniref:Uncharacterized protein n=1 Tax=Coccomyxa subellipsoidea TaxID=248742 RepID=A0ABR2YYM8_9CHLO